MSSSIILEDKITEEIKSEFDFAPQMQNTKKAEQMFDTPKDANLIYDVGMHRGEDTDYYLKKGFRVVGFEANPENAAFCRHRFAEAISQNRLTLIEGAIIESDSSEPPPKKVKFYRNVDHTLWGSTSDDWASRNEVMGTSNEIIEVNATDFKSCLAQYGIPYYLKADIVGSEMLCLRALLKFKNKPDYISIRSEKFIFRKLENEFDLLEQLGYNNFQAVQQDVSFMKAPLDSKEGKNISHNFEEGASGVFGKDLRETWQTKNQALKDYSKIFILYRLFGDYSFLRRFKLGNKFIEQLERIARRPLPGWYDTHARHSSVKLLSACLSASILFS